MELTNEERRRVQGRKNAGAFQVTSSIGRRSGPNCKVKFAPVQKSSLPWLLGMCLVVVVAAIWFVDYFGP